MKSKPSHFEKILVKLAEYAMTGVFVIVFLLAYHFGMPIILNQITGIVNHFTTSASPAPPLQLTESESAQIVDSGTIPAVNLYENPNEVELKYTLRGQQWKLNFTTYGGLNNFLKEKSRSLYCPPTGCEKGAFDLQTINEDNSRKEILGIVNSIKTYVPNKDDQARAVISIVQNIPYDTIGFTSKKLDNKFPYEVLYTNTGVCGEKSRLLAILLKELDFGVALLHFGPENHMAIGISCPAQYSYKNTSYCFVETTKPNIATNSDNEYVNVGKLVSEPEVIVVNHGLSLDSISEDFYDSQQLSFLKENKNPENYSTRIELKKKYGLLETGCQTGDQLCDGECYNPCTPPRIFSCTITGGACNYDPNNCPSNMVSCNGKCFPQCENGTFKCEPTGGVCYIQSSNCPIGTTRCNSKCWTNCAGGTFVCTPTGAICQH